MNTNDFYKELFEKYALDEEKIRRNAIKAAKTPAWQRAVGAHWKSVAGAAAAVAVTVAGVAYAANNDTGVTITPSENLLSAAERLHAAERDYYDTTPEAEGMADIYVTFLDDLSYNDMSVSLSALPDSEDIDIECLYLNDSTVIRGKEAIEAYAEAGSYTENIAAAKLRAPRRCFRDIKDLSKVYIAEFGSDDINDDTFVPIDYNDEDPLKNANDFITTTAMPAETTTPFSFASETVIASEIAESGNDADTTEPPEDTEAEETDDEPEDDEIADETTDSTEDGEVVEIDEPDTTSAPDAESDTTSVSETTAETTVSSDELPDAPEIGLMTQIYQLNVENALDTLLIGDHAIVLTRNEAYVYKLGGIVAENAKVYSISSPKVAYTDEKTVILTGCGSDGLRNTLFAVDLSQGSVYRKDEGVSLGSAEIGTINYSKADGKFFLKAVSSANTYLYELTVGGEDEIRLRPLFEYAGAVSPAGYRSGSLWFTAADESLKYSLYSFDCTSGIMNKEYSFGSDCKIRRSKSFESFIINTADADTEASVTYVFDTASRQLIPVELTGESMIAVRDGIIFVRSGETNYIVGSDGSLTETSAYVNYHSKPESGYGIMSSDSEKVVVAESNRWH